MMRDERSSAHFPANLDRSGDMGRRVGAFDWSATDIGAIEGWPPEMSAVLAFVLRSPTPIVTLWGDKGVMIYNDAYREFAGMRHPALLGSNVLEGWHEVADFNANVLQKVYREGGTLSYRDQELTLIRDGTPRILWTDLEYSPAVDATGRVLGVIAIVIETTERVLAERRAISEYERGRINAERVQLALGAGAIIGTWFWDLPSDQFTVDAAFARSFGLDPALGHSGIPLEQIIATVHPDDREGLIAAIDGVIARGGAYAHQYRVQRSDGRYYWIEANGRVDHAADGTPISFPGVLIDVDERRAVEAERDRAIAMLRSLNDDLERRVEERTRELRDSMDFARLALSAVGGVGVWTFDVATDCFTCDEAISRIYDIDPEQGARGIRRADFLANIHADDRASLRETMSGGLVNPGDLELEYRIVHRDGSIHWVLSRGHTYFDDEGRPTRRTGIGVDMTKPRLVEEQLRQSQKMEAVGQLTGGIAHDFNNLLQGITGSLEIVQRRIGQGRLDDLDRFIAGATTAANRAAALTHRLLAFSRRQPLDPRPVRPNTLIASMEDLLGRTMGENVELEMTLPGDLWTTRCDPNQLENAILNLAINARDAMPDGGRLTIETSNAYLDKAHPAGQRGATSGEFIRVRVTDTGSGMSADTIARAFEPFFTTKPIGQGTGLGLSMIYGFAQQSEGHAEIVSEIGRGTTFELYLPRHRGDASEDETTQDAGDAPASEAGEVVLVIEDEAVVRELIVEELRELGYAVLQAVDGPRGLELLRTGGRIDLLVTDIGLPGLNGRQVADAARQLRPTLKILFMTGYAENAALASGFLVPGMEMITKPFAMEALASRIRGMIEG